MNAELKKQLYEMCQTYAKTKVNDLADAIKDVQDSANNETRNTSGDKHDTSRAMMQLEVEQLSKQLEEAEKLGPILKQFSSTTKSELIALGSLVKTNAANYYISIGAGKLLVKNEICFAVSALSPIALALIKKKKGDSFEFNGKKFKIEEVC